jgi:hypothetical protein
LALAAAQGVATDIVACIVRTGSGAVMRSAEGMAQACRRWSQAASSAPRSAASMAWETQRAGRRSRSSACPQPRADRGDPDWTGSSRFRRRGAACAWYALPKALMRSLFLDIDQCNRTAPAMSLRHNGRSWNPLIAHVFLHVRPGTC